MKNLVNFRIIASLKLIILLVVFSISNPLLGQSLAEFSINNVLNPQTKDSVSKKISYTPKFGLTIANQKEKIDEGTTDHKRKAILGFMAGVGVNKPVFDNISLESGLFIVQKGSKSDSEGFSDGDEFYSYSDILRMLYIDIPIFVQYSLNDNESSLVFYGGIQPSFLINAKRKNKTANQETKETVTEFFKKFDAAASVGIGYQFKNGLGISANYDHGFVNINKSTDPNGNNYFKTYNRVLKFTIAWQFGDEKASN